MTTTYTNIQNYNLEQHILLLACQIQHSRNSPIRYPPFPSQSRKVYVYIASLIYKSNPKYIPLDALECYTSQRGDGQRRTVLFSRPTRTAFPAIPKTYHPHGFIISRQPSYSPDQRARPSQRFQILTGKSHLLSNNTIVRRRFSNACNPES